MFILLLSVLLITNLVQADLPPEIQKCRAADVDCVATTINKIMRLYPKGNTELGLKPIDDIEFSDFVLSKARENAPVKLNLKFKKVHIYGFEKFKVTRVVGFEKDPKKAKFEIYGTIPLLVLKGTYIMDGKILLLPMTGDGNAEITLTNATLGMKVKCDVTVKDGKQYIQISKMKSSVNVELLHTKMDNMFNGNQELGDSVLKIINDSWKDVWEEVRDGTSDAVTLIGKTLTNSVIEKLSYDDFYSD